MFILYQSMSIIYINIYQSFHLQSSIIKKKTSKKTQTSLHTEILSKVEKTQKKASAPLWNLKRVTNGGFVSHVFKTGSQRIQGLRLVLSVFLGNDKAKSTARNGTYLVSGRHPGDCRMIRFLGYHLSVMEKNTCFFKVLGMWHTFQLWKSSVYYHQSPSPIITDIPMMWFSCFKHIRVVPPSTFHTKSTYPLRYPGMSQERGFLYNPIVGSGGLVPWILLDRKGSGILNVYALHTPPEFNH